MLVKFDDWAPEWRYLETGLNLEGVCMNRGCLAYHKKVWIPKGFGIFNMSREVHQSKCPMCHKPCECVDNLGIYLAKCASRGRIKGELFERV